MNAWFVAVLNGFAVSASLAAVAGVAFRVTRGSLNSATRYAVWWVLLLIVCGLPGLFLPRRAARVTLTSPSSRFYERLEHTERRFVGKVQVPPGPQAARGPVLPLRIGAGSATVFVESVWALASLAMLCRLAISVVLLQVRKRRAVEAPEWLAETMKRSLARCGVKRRVRIAVSAEGASPMVAGCCVLVPSRLLTTLERAQIEQICLHEAAHLARFDDWALLTERLIEALFAVHPVVRWIARQIDLEREIACDDFVVALTGEARSYASCLTHVAELALGYSGSPVAAAAADESAHLNRRIEMLLNKTRRAGTRILKARFGVGLIALAVLTWLAGKSPMLFAIASPALTVFRAVPQAPLLQTAPVARPQKKPSVPQQQEVRIPVTVMDRGDHFVTGLTRTAFQVFEDGVERQITQVQSGNADASLVIVQSQPGDTAALQKEILRVERQLAELERVYKPDYPDIKRLREQLATLRARNVVRTFLDDQVAAQARVVAELRTRYDEHHPGVREAEELLQQLEDRIPLTRANFDLLPRLRAAAGQSKPGEAIVIVFDALDRSIFLPENEVNALIRESAVPIYSIAVGQEEPTNFLDLLTEATGGVSYRAADMSEVRNIEDKIVVDLQNRYMVTYVAKPGSADGTWHRIEVRVTPPRDLPPVEVHTIPGRY